MKNKISGLSVSVRDNEDITRALRKFKNLVKDSGNLKTLQRKEFYEKPTTMRKRKKAASCARQMKKLHADQLPSKHNR